ncbi:MAG: hypothetical protein V1918_08260 [Planctomycetota bacterium]
MNSKTIRPASRRRERGSALTELAILLFPYAMLLLGVILLGELSLGRQESQKASFFATALPGVQSRETMLEYTFPGRAGNARNQIDFTEVQDPDLDQSYSEEEPVLPYLSPQDIHAGFIRIENPRQENTLRTDDGTVSLQTQTVTTFEGYYLRNMGILPDREADIARLLGAWATYSAARTQYGFTYGGRALRGEEGDEARNPRATFTLKQTRDETLQEGLEYYGAARSEPTLGTHRPGPWQRFGEPDMQFGALRGLDLVDVPGAGGGVALDPESMPASSLDGFSLSYLDAMWDVMNTLNPNDWKPPPSP